MTENELNEIERRVVKNYRTVIVDGFIVNPVDRTLLLQKRSPDRRLFPNSWDTIGGHLENGESFLICLAREMKEESGMGLMKVLALVNEFEWEEDQAVVNLQFVCLAEGNPTPEQGKVSEIRWVSHADLAQISESLTGQMRTGIEKAFAYIEEHSQTLRR